MSPFRDRQLLTVLWIGIGMVIGSSPALQAIAGVPPCLSSACRQEKSVALSPASGILAQGRLNSQMDFFDIGQRKLEQEITRMQQQPPSSTVTVSPGLGYWQPITSNAGSFSVWMAPGTLTEETKAITTRVGQLKFNVFASNSGSDRCVVAYTNLPQSVTTQPTDTVLTAIRERLKSRTSYKLASEKSISLGAYPGRDLTFSGSGEMITVRYYLANQRLYLIAAKNQGNALSSTSTTFLNSFQISDR